MPATRASSGSKTGESSKTPIKSKPEAKQTKKKTPMSDLQRAIADLKKSDEQCKKLSVSDLKDLDKNLKKAFDKTKRETQLFEQERLAAKPSRTRSGKRRGPSKVDNKQKSVYSEGRWIVKGMDEAREKFDDDEIEFLKKCIAKTKNVGDLKSEHLRYLIAYQFLDELKSIKRGEVKSTFHETWERLHGRCQHELQSEIKTTLFTNEQKDYISGMLQELFDANKKDDNGDIRHTDINYVVTVMLAEANIRIVKYIHNFESLEETIDFMKKSAREAYGISSDEE